MAQTCDSHTRRDQGCKGGDPEHPSQNGAGCPVGSMWACVIVEHKHTLTVFQFLLALLPHVSMFHLNNPYIYRGMQQHLLLRGKTAVVLVNDSQHLAFSC
jgi:hypothetical protein